VNFFMIHGGAQGGWCWDGVIAELASAGHTSFALTLPGCEPGTLIAPKVGLSDLISFAVGELSSLDWDDAVVVSHSGGGPVAQGVAEALRGNVRQLIFVDAFVLDDGQSLLEAAQADRDDGQSAITDEIPAAAFSPEEHWVNELCRDMTEAEARSWLPKVVPIPMGWLTESVELTQGTWRTIPAAYVLLEGESSAARGMYEGMARKLQNPTIVRCAGAHEAMLSQPKALAAALLDAIRVS
jgi:pimeloyl-ACP methyl ester carboxylesterase